MDLNDAVNDTERPLSVPPDVWLELKQRRGTVTAKVADAKPLPLAPPDEEAMIKVEMAVDTMLASLKDLVDSLEYLNKAKLDDKEKEVYGKVSDLVDTAIVPYMSDIVEMLDGLDEEGEE